MMKRADSGRTYPELDREVLETLKDASETPDFDSIRESLRLFGRCDESVRNCLIAEWEYIWKDERTGKLVVEYLDNSRRTAYLYIDLEKGLSQVRKMLRSIGVMLKKITPEIPLSDAQYLEISIRLMDYKTLEPFKDFEEKWGPVLKGHEQLLEKLKERKKEFEEENVRGHKQFLEKLEERKKEFEEEDCDYHKAKEEPKHKRWSIWRWISAASAMAVAAISVVVAFCVPHIPFVRLMAPVFCGLGFTFANQWFAPSRKDQRAAEKAEKRAEAEKAEKRAEAEKEKKRAEAEKEKKRAEAKKDVDTMHECTSVMIERMKNAQVLHAGLAGCSSSFVGYIDLCLESKENLLEYLGEINKGQKSIIKKLDGLSTALETHSEELHERRESLISMMARYI